MKRCFVCRSTEPRYYGWIRFDSGWFCGLACQLVHYKNLRVPSWADVLCACS